MRPHAETAAPAAGSGGTRDGGLHADARQILRAIVGTAGHIDHGKSALVHALTGIDTDRLPEERERGISIELGFAHLDLDGIGRVGIVDVPGHERFIRQMLAGAHGFDLVLMVVAADDGVMPQTEEHFDIVHLLGVRRAIFVVTKIDAASADRVRDVCGEIEILAAGTPFEDAPVCTVSARTGQGLESLRREIAAALDGLESKPEHGILRIPVDRVFVRKGHGVIVTGTAIAGRVEVGDEVMLLPGERRSRVREIQVHGEAAAFATAGQRVALNLAGLDKDSIVRGDTVTAAATAAAAGGGLVTSRLDARIEVRPAARRPLASHVRVRVHHGTRETPARLIWLDGIAEVAPRSSGFAQLALAVPLVAAEGDRFIIRDETASRTLGGGVVLLAHAEKHRRSRGDVRPDLERLEHGEGATRLHALLTMASGLGLAPGEAARAAGMAESELLGVVASDPALAALPDERSPELVATTERLERTLSDLAAAVVEFERDHPSLAGVDVEHLRGMMRPAVDSRTFRLLVDRLLAGGRLHRSGNVVRSPAHAPALSGADDAIAARFLSLVETAGVTPPTIKEGADALGIPVDRARKVAGVLALRGQLVKISADMFYSAAALDGIRERLARYLEGAGEISPAGFRDLIAASRKHCIPLLDWFDRSGMTIRVGDVRKLRRS